jgi:protocatechuate 3,4-dioxygenase beta subunit
VAAGVPLSIRLQVVNTNGGCGALDGYAIYIWQCDRDGNYSLYSPGTSDQNFLRGVQVSDSNGSMSFTTIYPGCYPGRVPHVHFEIYRSLAAAGNVSNRILTSQFTFPEAASNAVYATPGYSGSVNNMAAISLSTDMVFRDGFAQQMVSITGNVIDGYVATLAIGVAA